MKRNCFSIARYAYENVPFYKRILIDKGISAEELFCEKEGWNQLPIIEKKDVAEHNSAMISEDFLGLYARDKLISSHTSGTSGSQVDVYWERGDYCKSLLALWAERWHQAGIHPRDRVCYFNTMLENETLFQYKKNSLIISKKGLSYEKLVGVMDEIVRFRPKWLLLHPTIALLICEIMEQEHIHIPSISYIELTGEMIIPSLIKRLKNCFQCVVKAHYGTMEVNTIGYEFSQEKYALFENSTYVEILDENGNVLPDRKNGYIYVTSLHNRAMPFVRYGVGDMGFIEKYTTESGEIRLLTLSCAKRGEHILFLDGARISADVLLEPVSFLSGMGEKIVYQIIAKQVSQKEIQITFVIDNEIDRQEFINFYLQNLPSELLQSFNFMFYFKDRVQNPDNTGKVGWYTPFM